MSDSNVFRGKAFMASKGNTDFTIFNHFSYFLLSIGFAVVLFIVIMTLCCHCTERLIGICFKHKRPHVERRRMKRLITLLTPEDDESAIRETDRIRRSDIMRGEFLTEHTICQPYVYRDRNTTGLTDRLHGLGYIVEMDPDFITRERLERRSRADDSLRLPIVDSLPPCYDVAVNLTPDFPQDQTNCDPPPPSYKDCMKNNNSRHKYRA